MSCEIEKANKPVQGTNEVVSKNEEQKWYQTVPAKLNSPVTFWIFFFVALFFYLQKQLSYHFYYIEQEQLFLWSSIYWKSVIMESAGLSRLLTEFCVQFFIRPYYGALIMSAWFTFTGMLTAGIIRRIAPTANLFLLSLLQIALLIIIHFDTNYHYQGTMAYMMMLSVMYGYFSIRQEMIRTIYAVFFGVLLFWWAGGVACLFVVCVFLRELINSFSRSYIFILPLLAVGVFVYYSVYTSYIGDFHYALLPDFYYTSRLRPEVAIYFPWIYMPLLLLIAQLLHHRKNVRGGRKLAEMIFYSLLIAAVYWFGMGKFVNRSSDFYKELDYYMRTEQWDNIINRCSGKIDNYLYKCCLNAALAEKGELADRMFSFDQKGIQSIYMSWNRVPHIAVLLSDVYFSMGQIAMAQKMAFEANESISLSGGPRMLKKLVQTNLIYGAYQVAEKYLDLLEQTKYYRKWAHEHRHFLWNDEAIAHDSLLSIKRKCVPGTDLLSEVQGLNNDLEIIARQNPAHIASIQYAGACYLLIKEILFFEKFIARNYRTEVLPFLPESWQEAIVILSEQDPSYLEKYDISESVIQRYNAFKRQVLTNRNNSASLPGLLKKGFGNTYWYYYMFIKIDE